MGFLIGVLIHRMNPQFRPTEAVEIGFQINHVNPAFPAVLFYSIVNDRKWIVVIKIVKKWIYGDQ